MEFSEGNVYICEKGTKPIIKIIAIPEVGEEFEVDDLYWFEEQGFHDFSGDGFTIRHKFRIDVYLPDK